MAPAAPESSTRCSVACGEKDVMRPHFSLPSIIPSVTLVEPFLNVLGGNT